jgi:hypothetical protein
MHSSAQIAATLFMLGNLETCFSPLFAIQIAAFLMTLVRKSIITANTWHILYSLSLWINVFCYYSTSIKYIFIQVILMKMFEYWRFHLPNKLRGGAPFIGNKYIGWVAAFAMFYVYDYHYGVPNLTDSYKAIRTFIIIRYLLMSLQESFALFSNKE